MTPERPDLTNLPDAVKAYILELETELEKLRGNRVRLPAARQKPRIMDEDEAFNSISVLSEPAEPSTTINVITATASGVAKRTPRHHYIRQRRGGMGIFDLDTPDHDPAAIVAIADISQHLLLLTNHGRAYRLSVSAITETAIRARAANRS